MTHEQHTHQPQPSIEVCGLDFQFRHVDIADSTPSGAQIAAAAGFRPASDATVLHILANGELEDIRPDESVDVSAPITRFIVVESDRTYRLTVDGTRYDWPGRVVSGGLVRKLASISSDKSLYFERRDEPDQHMSDTDLIDLAEEGVEHFYSRVRPQTTVTIVVEATPHEWSKEKISYAEVVTLEVPDYPQHPEITYSVSYKKGPANKPEGILVLGASVKVKEGMEFYVSETGQS